MVALGVQSWFLRVPGYRSEGRPIPIPQAGETPREISWTCHPARERPVVAAVTGLFLAGLVLAVQLSWKEWYVTAIAALVLWLSVAPFFLPTRYESNGQRIAVKSVLQSRDMPWSRYRRAAADRRGALLSPFERRSRLDRRHGLNLRYDERDRERVLAHLELKVPVDRADGI